MRTPQNALLVLSQTPTPPACSCQECKNMCKRPCWPTPEEAVVLISAGYGDRLMADWWDADCRSDDRHVNILSPAFVGFEGKSAPFELRGHQGCTFFKDGKCELHDLGLKPTEGRLAIHTMGHDALEVHQTVMETWADAASQDLVQKWINDQAEKCRQDPERFDGLS